MMCPAVLVNAGSVAETLLIPPALCSVPVTTTSDKQLRRFGVLSYEESIGWGICHNMSYPSSATRRTCQFAEEFG